MKTARPLLIATAAVSVLGLLTGCGGGSSSSAATGVSKDCKPKFTFPTISKGTLTIAAPEAPPYFSNAGGKQTGIDLETLDQFAKDACLKASWNVIPAAGDIEAVRTKRVDITAGGWYATPDRGKVVNQSDPVYVELPTIFSKSATSDVNALKGKTVGTVTGYAWVPDLKNLYGDKLKEYQSTDAALSDLATGRSAAAVLGGIDAPYLVSQNARFKDIVAKTMAPTAAVAVSEKPSLPNYPHTKGNDKLTAALNKELAELRSSGRIAEILKKYNIDPKLADVEKYR
ncbi:substrate-binding periplasmic protein [Streptomyces sp. NPDC004752]